jgi:2-oxoisovalerate dehydrogenase E1 component
LTTKTNFAAMPTASQIEEALLIRRVENTFLSLFSQGKLNGTVHTSVGQEFSAIAFAGQLTQEDFVFSNHRCHGHYIAFTKDDKGLLSELLGKVDGTCGGVGSSQHLQKGNFYSNGIQGGTVAVAAGMALAKKLNGKQQIGVVYIGDGTLGEGIVYETLNLLALWKLPLLVVCENNHYAQSTRTENSLAGDILARAQAFGIHTFQGCTHEPDTLITMAKEAIDTVRLTQKPMFCLVDTYRLNPHSKGDDDRPVAEIEAQRERDFLVRFAKAQPESFAEMDRRIQTRVDGLVATALAQTELSTKAYLEPTINAPAPLTWHPISASAERQVALLNRYFKQWLGINPKHIFLGEDVLSPYGGAFKVARDLSAEFPSQVISTPISEAAITGIANGLALAGHRPVLEIMFGDFITLALDQLINHASKFFHMYNRQVSCPLVVRTPMGGYRGYGPTHSQTLDRLLIGIDNVTVVALNSLIDPKEVLDPAFTSAHPVVVIENKTDYGKFVSPPHIANYFFEVAYTPYPIISAKPIKSQATLTVVTYGGISTTVLACIEALFMDYEIKAEVIVLTCISPIDYRYLSESVARSRRLVVVEEGSQVGGIGSEIISTLATDLDCAFKSLKIGALAVPIPSVRSLEDIVLPTCDRIIADIAHKFA